MSVPIVSVCYTFEFLLTRRIPNLQVNEGPVNQYRFFLKSKHNICMYIYIQISPAPVVMPANCAYAVNVVRQVSCRLNEIDGRARKEIKSMPYARRDMDSTMLSMREWV